MPAAAESAPRNSRNTSYSGSRPTIRATPIAPRLHRSTFADRRPADRANSRPPLTTPGRRPPPLRGRRARLGRQLRDAGSGQPESRCRPLLLDESARAKAAGRQLLMSRQPRRTRRSRCSIGPGSRWTIGGQNPGEARRNLGAAHRRRRAVLAAGQAADDRPRRQPHRRGDLHGHRRRHPPLRRSPQVDRLPRPGSQGQTVRRRAGQPRPHLPTRIQQPATRSSKRAGRPSASPARSPRSTSASRRGAGTRSPSSPQPASSPACSGVYSRAARTTPTPSRR